MTRLTTKEQGFQFAFFYSDRPDEITAAVETDLSFTFGGDANWVNTTAESYYCQDSARSGTISNSQQSWIETTVQGPGTISFYWKISTESSSGDDLRFLVDGSIKLNVDGDQRAKGVMP